MWRRTTLQLLLCATCFLMIQCQANSDCLMPTEHAKVTICSYCSDSHAGVRWAVHQSAIDDYPHGAYAVDLKFHCNILEVVINNTDDCFNGDLIPGLTFLTTLGWHWHILEHTLPDGAECHFTAKVEDGLRRSLYQLNTSCTVHDNRSMILPATCSTSGRDRMQTCSCQCGEGFKIDEDFKQNELLTCLNVDECTEGTQYCNNTSSCVDTDGSYYCINDNKTTASNSSVVNTMTHDQTRVLPQATTHATVHSLAMTDNQTRVLPQATTHATVHSLDYTPRLVSAIAVIIAVSLASVVIAVVISISLLRKKQYLSRDRKIMTISSQLADSFDSDFCPAVDIEKFDSISLSAFSVKTTLDPLQDSTNVNADMLSASSSFGSIIILDFCD